MKKLLCLFFVLMVSMQISSQEKLIQGVITDEFGLHLAGVNILVKDSSIGALSDFDGAYSIVACKGDILVFSYIGMKTKEIKVSTLTTINVKMIEDDAVLEEVVVIGYGTGKRRSMVGSMAKVNRKKLVSNRKTNVKRAIQGQVSGVQIMSKSGAPGAGYEVVVRGASSLTGGSNPLYVVDGVKVEADGIGGNHLSQIYTLNPSEIESIKVLKDASATAIYGSRGANGVVIITTKSGNAGNVDFTKNQSNFIEVNNESYAVIKENDFKRTFLSPLSTFSIDVDKASYSNIRRMINNGMAIDPNAVKIEEMINYFDYNYPEPTGEHPFSINTEVAKTPWNGETKIVKIGLQGKTYDNNALPASNLVFLIDVSGSMDSQNKLPLLKSAFKLLVNQLREKDNVSIVVYAGAAGVVLEPTSGKNKEKIISALDHLSSGGSTAGGQGIKLAYKLAEKHFKKGGNNRVIMATDGDFNVGPSSDKAMEKLIEEKRKSGVFLSVLGFGYGNYQDSKLEILADKGNGNHAYIDNMQEARKVFGKEFGGTLFTIAKDVKIQVEFNPTKAQAYRLIGYENRMLEDEDFIDDTIDAGELGSGHTVTALYEVIPVGVKSEYLKDVPDLKYTKTTATSSFTDELFTVKFRYKKPDGDKGIEMIHMQKDEVKEASEDFNFATAVALFGMQLRHSKYTNKAKTSQVIDLVKAGRGEDKEGFRSEFKRLVSSYQSIY